MELSNSEKQIYMFAIEVDVDEKKFHLKDEKSQEEFREDYKSSYEENRGTGITTVSANLRFNIDKKTQTKTFISDKLLILEPRRRTLIEADAISMASGSIAELRSLFPIKDFPEANVVLAYRSKGDFKTIPVLTKDFDVLTNYNLFKKYVVRYGWNDDELIEAIKNQICFNRFQETKDKKFLNYLREIKIKANKIINEKSRYDYAQINGDPLTYLYEKQVKYALESFIDTWCKSPEHSKIDYRKFRDLMFFIIQNMQCLKTNYENSKKL